MSVLQIKIHIKLPSQHRLLPESCPPFWKAARCPKRPQGASFDAPSKREDKIGMYGNACKALPDKFRFVGNVLGSTANPFTIYDNIHSCMTFTIAIYPTFNFSKPNASPLSSLKHRTIPENLLFPSPQTPRIYYLLPRSFSCSCAIFSTQSGTISLIPICESIRLPATSSISLNINSPFFPSKKSTPA